jgi:hypothetical protein
LISVQNISFFVFFLNLSVKTSIWLCHFDMLSPAESSRSHWGSACEKLTRVMVTETGHCSAKAGHRAGHVTQTRDKACSRVPPCCDVLFTWMWRLHLHLYTSLGCGSDRRRTAFFLPSDVKKLLVGEILFLKMCVFLQWFIWCHFPVRNHTKIFYQNSNAVYF